MLANLASCSTCAAQIIWARTERGQAMPLDAMPPLLGGNIELTEPAPGQRDPIARVHASSVCHPGWYVSHFSTCAQAPQHRRLRPDGRRR